MGKSNEHHLLVGDLEHGFYFPQYMGQSFPLTNIFQRGRYTTNQIMYTRCTHPKWLFNVEKSSGIGGTPFSDKLIGVTSYENGNWEIHVGENGTMSKY